MLQLQCHFAEGRAGREMRAGWGALAGWGGHLGGGAAGRERWVLWVVWLGWPGMQHSYPRSPATRAAQLPEQRSGHKGRDINPQQPRAKPPIAPAQRHRVALGAP